MGKWLAASGVQGTAAAAAGGRPRKDRSRRASQSPPVAPRSLCLLGCAGDECPRASRASARPICSLLSLRAKCCIGSARVMPLGRSRSALRISSATGSPSVSPNTGARPRGGGLRYVPWCPRHRPLAPPQGAAVVRRAGRAVRPRGRGAGPTWVPRARRPTRTSPHRPRCRQLGRGGARAGRPNDEVAVMHHSRRGWSGNEAPHASIATGTQIGQSNLPRRDARYVARHMVRCLAPPAKWQ